MTLSVRFSLVFILFFLATCRSSRQTLSVHTLPNYDATAAHRILFLDFAISRSAPGEPERITLTNSIVGNGEMKRIPSVVHSPYQIKLVRHYTDNRPPETDSLEHPLIRSIEIADTDGILSRKLTSDLDGHFSVRFPYTNAVKQLDIYSVTPDKGTLKIHTLRLKP